MGGLVGKRSFDLVVMSVCFTLLGYFAWHAFEGPRGFDHHEALLARAAKLDEGLATVAANRGKLERRVSLMRPESVDPDMLDELARKTLDSAKPDELVVVKSR
jgi:cell division protein FtsB